MKKIDQKKRLIFGGLFLFCLFAAEIFLIPQAHDGAWWHRIKGSYLLLGIAGGLALMSFAKALGAFFLYRKDNYYE